MGRSLYYAMGGGLGHLTRARAVLTTLRQDALVLSASPHSRNPAVTQGLDVLSVPQEIQANPGRLGPWLAELIQQTKPPTLFLDSFPVGIVGELGEMEFPPGVAIHHLARRLRWDEYAPLIHGGPPKLDLVSLLEPLEAAHLAWLQAHGRRRLLPLAISYPAEEDGPGTAATLQRLATLPPPRWLVVHSGPENEIKELLAYAREMAEMERRHPNIVLIAPSETLSPAALPEDVLHLPLYPARTAFPLAQCLITACGFNLMQETAPWRAIQRVLPMPRRFDDQYARAALHFPRQRLGRGDPPYPLREGLGNS